VGHQLGNNLRSGVRRHIVNSSVYLQNLYLIDFFIAEEALSTAAHVIGRSVDKGQMGLISSASSELGKIS